MRILIQKMIRNTIILVALSIVAKSVSAEAFCALRDPVSSIKKLFPESTNHKSIVRSIDEAVRLKVGDEFPQLPLHFGELGRHTLYVVMKNSRPVGMVHVRSEQSPWGLVEIAWALNMDLTIRDFYFQRCRNRQKKLLDTADFKLQFMGKNFDDVKALYDETTNAGTPAFLSKASGADELANVVLKCAIKTLLVTRIAWDEDITNLVNTPLLEKLKSSDEIQLQAIDDVMNKSTQERLTTVTGSENLGIERDSVKVYKVIDDNAHELALLYVGMSQIDSHRVTLSWLLSMQGKVISVGSDRTWPSADIESLFMQTQGRSFENIDQCGNRAELYGLEVATTVQPYFEKRLL